MGVSPADCEALLSPAKGLSYQIGIKYGYCVLPCSFANLEINTSDLTDCCQNHV